MSAHYEKTELLQRAGMMIDSIVSGLDEVEVESMKRIMERSGEACAIYGSLSIAKRIADESKDIDEIIARANE